MRCNWPEGVDILKDIIKATKATISSYDDRVFLYEKYLEIWIENDCLDIEECLGIDKAFTTAYNNVI